MNRKIKTSIGLMSGTSIDGIDVALIKSDGKIIKERGQFCHYYPYDQELKIQMQKLIHNQIINLRAIKEIEQEITHQHIKAVKDFLQQNNLTAGDIDIIGFHGHTILHHPHKAITWQIGNAQSLASEVAINVVSNFRNKDLVYGGQGAPLAPIYHFSLFSAHKKPLAVLNIGGVANLTYIEDDDEENLIAFDIGFGNAPFDDLMRVKRGKDFDENGALASMGQIHYDLAEEFLTTDYFTKSPPKSIDRNHFQQLLSNKFLLLPLNDALASLAYILAKTLEAGLKFVPQPPRQIIICGGGRHNAAIIDNIKKVITDIEITIIDDLKINGDFTEAEAFAFLALRHLANLPISFPKTTGIKIDNSKSSSLGGVLYKI